MPPAKRVAAMDDRFPDLMSELGDIGPNMLKARWRAVVGVAAAAGDHEKCRLVSMACGDQVSRQSDEWFWKPFRAGEKTFRVDAVELHSRLAVACLRRLIGEEDDLAPMLVNLAVLSGLTPIKADLATEALGALQETAVEPPDFDSQVNFYTGDQQEKLKADGGADTATLSLLLNKIAYDAQQAVAGIADAARRLSEWARDAEVRFETGQQMMQWLLGGIRSDGRSWSDLTPGATVVDASCELADFVLAAPQPRHEAVLNQVLSVAGLTDSSTKIKPDEAVEAFDLIDDDALRQLCPISAALVDGEDLPKVSPYDLARRLLWERAVIARWAGE
jgi:hypothetical protein